MQATASLEEDHRLIEGILRSLEVAARRLRETEVFQLDDLEKALDFMTVYLDKYHFSKEEQFLLPAIQVHGISKNSGPVGILLQEHNAIRRYIATLVDSFRGRSPGAKTMQDVIVENAHAYARLLTEHFWKEENILFIMVNQVLTATEEIQLLEEFGRLESRVLGTRKERYANLAATLSQKYDKI